MKTLRLFCLRDLGEIAVERGIRHITAILTFELGFRTDIILENKVTIEVKFVEARTFAPRYLLKASKYSIINGFGHLLNFI